MPRDLYCPTYRSLDLFGDRWSLLVVREILRGVRHFNEIERSLPGISRSTLAQRLRHLEKEGVVERAVGGDGKATTYELTEAGRELVPVIEAVSDWGVRWLSPRMRPSDIDPDGLMIWISRHVVLRALPARRVVIRFELRAKRRRSFWLVLRTGDASLCPDHPGFPEDVTIAARPSDLHRLFVGRISFASAIDEGVVEVAGPPSIVRSLPAWFVLRASGPEVPLAPVAR